MNKRKCFVLLSAALAVMQVQIPSYGAWIQKDNHWVYEDNQIYEKNAWKMINEAWYYFDDTGYMVTGWRLIDSKWYFLNPVSDGTKGIMLTGWQWIDGRCYYLSGQSENTHPKGAMYINEKTPDGYSVDSTGAWIDEFGTLQYVSGMGIQTVTMREAASENNFSGRGSGGGGAGSWGSSVKPDKGTKPDNGPKDSIPDVGESETIPVIPAPDESLEETNEPREEGKQYRYTVRCMDVKDKTILHAIVGMGVKGGTIAVIQPVIDGYQLCNGQKESFMLTSDQMILNVYYERENVATPSEARKVAWNLYFVEKENLSNEILKAQQGLTVEDNPLVVDFPEIILGADRYYYHSLVPSPWSVIVNGNGTQKYYIEFVKGEYLQEEEGPDQGDKDKLEKWLSIAKEADIRLSGQEPSDQQLITKNIEESNERLLNLVSMADGTERKEIYLIAKGHVPSTVIISQTFHNIKNLSVLVMDEFNLADEKYTIIRVGFEKTYDESTCSHDYQITDKVNTTCTSNGHETVRCRKCGKEETVILPATGHVDSDHDGICEVCYSPASEIPEAVHYNIGDIQARTIGNKVYLFRCVDEDYEDVMGNSQGTALFLCDCVIRSDIIEKTGHAIDGAENKLIFGSNNNYKYSDIREWLLNHASADFIHETYIGITRSYIGATWKGSYEQFNDNSLMAMKEMFQLMYDKVFILSVDEALKYRDVLWRFNGSETNNPGTQISAYSKGYYLRTPQDLGLNDFLYGDRIYAVSLVDGNIQPVSVNDTSFGIRPAMAIPQG